MKNKQKLETPLCKLAYKYGTDKCPRIKHNYTPYYYSLFKDVRKSIKLVFEMGIGYYKGVENNNTNYDSSLKRLYQKGASLKMWRDFFPNAKVIGADNQPAVLFKDKRIETYLCNQTDQKQVRNLLKKFSKKIDIFIDDALHNARYQIRLAETVLPLLNKTAIYIIEDVTNPKYICRYLEKYDCRIIECSKKYKDDKLIIVKRK